MAPSSIPAKRSADAQEDAWVADEDRFVLQQSRKKAIIRVQSGRAQPIDWLTVILSIIDPGRNPVDEDLDDDSLEIADPETLFDELSESELAELSKKIEALQNLEHSRSNRDYWVMMKTICRDRLKQFEISGRSARGIKTVSADLDKLLAPKSLPELEKLEKQINAKLSSDQPIDTDYWEHLLQSLLIYTAKAKLKAIAKTIRTSRQSAFVSQQIRDAQALRIRLEARLEASKDAGEPGASRAHHLDPEPMLRIAAQDKALPIIDIADWESSLAKARKSITDRGFVTARKQENTLILGNKRQKLQDEQSNPAYTREAARGLADNEEIFNMEVDVVTKNRQLWADKYKPRRPQYFNRVALGFEWNKYNQTHYDQDNPPPKVVQGYKFNIFYPELVDIMKAPRYKIERDDGRKRGETLAPAGEEDTCIIRFTAGPPYEDIAFRIVDREWDYSAKRERGFKSSFDKGVLQLSFYFKKVYYRK